MCVKAALHFLLSLSEDFLVDHYIHNEFGIQNVCCHHTQSNRVNLLDNCWHFNIALNCATLLVYANMKHRPVSLAMLSGLFINVLMGT